MPEIKKLIEDDRCYGQRKEGYFYLVGEGIDTSCGKLPVVLKCGRTELSRVIRAKVGLHKYTAEAINTPCLNCEDLGDTTCEGCALGLMDSNVMRVINLSLSDFLSPAAFFANARRGDVMIRLKEAPLDFEEGQKFSLVHPYGVVEYGEEVRVYPAVIATMEGRTLQYVVRPQEDQDYLMTLASQGIELVEVSPSY